MLCATNPHCEAVSCLKCGADPGDPCVYVPTTVSHLKSRVGTPKPTYCLDRRRAAHRYWDREQSIAARVGARTGPRRALEEFDDHEARQLGLWLREHGDLFQRLRVST